MPSAVLASTAPTGVSLYIVMSSEKTLFAPVEPGPPVSKQDYKEVVPGLRLELVRLQRRLLDEARFPVIIVVAGLNCAGRSETVNLLNEWMDPRFLMTEAYAGPSEEDRARPRFWRYWRNLPPKGRIAVIMHAWYAQPLFERFEKKIDRKELDRRLERAMSFEKLLVDDGALILKFWMHLGQEQQKKRLKKLSKDPQKAWRIGPLDAELSRRYDHFSEMAGDAVRRTSTAWAPWSVVDGGDQRRRSLEVGRAIRDALAERLEIDGTDSSVSAGEAMRSDHDSADLVASSLLPSLSPKVLSTLDMGLTISKDDYGDDLADLQARVNGLARRAHEQELPVVALFEGWDAAGKGGAVRRLTAAMDARHYRVVPIAAPSGEELAHHYLWRFWNHLGRAGRMTLFDRSWYGRVLVERVEGFAAEAEWRRAYGEINDFEDQLLDRGSVVLKFWLHITPDEQLARFKAREATPFKSWKLTPDDWRNREKWDRYESAVEEMVQRTSTTDAPWTLVEANCKRYARLKVLRTVAEALEGGLGGAPKKLEKRR